MSSERRGGPRGCGEGAPGAGAVALPQREPSHRDERTRTRGVGRRRTPAEQRQGRRGRRRSRRATPERADRSAPTLEDESPVAPPRAPSGMPRDARGLGVELVHPLDLERRPQVRSRRGSGSPTWSASARAGDATAASPCGSAAPRSRAVRGSGSRVRARAAVLPARARARERDTCAARGTRRALRPGGRSGRARASSVPQSRVVSGRALHHRAQLRDDLPMPTEQRLSASTRPSTASRRNSCRRSSSACANGSYVTSGSGGPRHSASASLQE